MAFWADYWKSLKPLDVEEPVDVWLHRPVGYVIAKASFSTPISPNQITVLSILLGIAGGACFVLTFPYHLQVGFLCVFSSAAFDCADGMLARMRKSSSAFGRMLDGVADLASIGGAAGGAFYYFVKMYWATTWQAGLAFACGVLTIWSTTFQTAAYDHYKNVYMRIVNGAREGEELGAAEARLVEAKKQPMGLWTRLSFFIYLSYLRAQTDWVKKFDPATTTALDALEHSEKNAAIYKKYAGPPMRLLRWFFGLGSLIFGLGVFMSFGRPDAFMVFRLFGYNGLFYLVFARMQRKASKVAFEEMRAQ